MKIDRTRNTIKNVIFGFINRFITILFPFVTRTIIINVLGVQYLGLGSLFVSILNILSLAELGFGTALVYSMYKPIAEDDTETVNALLNLYKKIYRVVGLIVLVAGLCLMPVLDNLIEGDYPSDINLYSLYLIYLLNTVISYFFFAYRNSLLSAHQRNDITSKINITVSVCLYICQIIVLLLFKNYYVYIIFLPLSTLAINICTLIITKKVYPQYFCKGSISSDSKKTIKKQIYSLFLHRIGYVIQSSIDNICISAFMGLMLLGKFNNYFYVMTSVQAFITIFKQSMLAGIGNSLIVENKEYNKKQFYKTVFILSWIVCWCSTCLLCLYQPFMELWVGTENMLSFSIVVCLVVLFYFGEMRGVVCTYKDALGMWYEDRFKPISISIFNMVITIISAYFGYFEGILIATIGSYIFVGFPWETRVFFKHYMQEKPTKYLLKHLFYLFSNGIIIVSTFAVCSLINVGGIAELLLKGIVCVILPNILFIIFNLKNNDFKSLLETVKNQNGIIGKLKNFVKKCLAKAKRLVSLMFYLVPVNKNKITFCNFAGKGYGCSPKYLAEEFIKENRYKLIWFVSDMNLDLPKEITKVKYGSLKHYYHLITARLWIDNIRNNLKPIFKRKKQIYVQTWHGGVGIKGIEKDVEEYLGKDYLKAAKIDGKMSDYVLSGSDHLTRIIERAFWFNGEVLKLGIPRDDILFDWNEDEILKTKKELGLEGKKIILYAPSFRLDKDFYKNLNFDTEKLVKAFDERFGGNHAFCIRLHPNDATKENIEVFKNAVNLNVLSDSNIALHCADYVISDYSSMIFDFARLDRISLVYAPDYDVYTKNERKLYFDIKESVFPFAQSFDDLLSNISNFDDKAYKKNMKKFNDFFGFYDNNNSSQRVKDFLKDKMK